MVVVKVVVGGAVVEVEVQVKVVVVAGRVEVVTGRVEVEGGAVGGGVVITTMSFLSSGSGELRFALTCLSPTSMAEGSNAKP
mmetsp:Transcript_14734/g.30845  ORF Transcript_14734/g.30845 Transcript_14734/m.30845 type:complete len:82 (-) Transcript_14734:3248-3493(-)